MLHVPTQKCKWLMCKNHWNITVLEVACCQNYSQKHWEKDSTARSRLWARVTIYWKYIAGVINPQSLWILNTFEVKADGGSRLILQHLFFFWEYIVWIKTCLVEPTEMITQTQIHLEAEIYALVGKGAERTAQQQSKSPRITLEREFFTSW